jgi:hypothetical protein
MTPTLRGLSYDRVVRRFILLVLALTVPSVWAACSDDSAGCNCPNYPGEGWCPTATEGACGCYAGWMACPGWCAVKGEVNQVAPCDGGSD